jgi:hypothetical protein
MNPVNIPITKIINALANITLIETSVLGEVSLEPVFFERAGLILYFKMN